MTMAVVVVGVVVVRRVGVGVGMRVDMAVRRVLADRSYAAGAAKVRGWYAGRDGAAEAASAIRRWLVAGATRSTGAPAARPQQEPVPARAA